MRPGFLFLPGRASPVLLVMLLLHGACGRAQPWKQDADSAWQYHAQNKNALAVITATRALNIAAATSGTSDTVLADILSSIAWYNWCEGWIDPAYAAVDSALKIYDSTIGHAHPKVADALHRKGTCLWDLARYSEGEESLREAVRLRIVCYGPESEPALRSLINLAGLLQEEGKIGEAERLYSRLLAIWKRQGVPLSQGVVNNLGSFYTALGRFALAESLFAGVMRSPAWTGEDPFILTNLGLLYQETARPESAEVAFKRSIAAFDAVEGKDNPDNAIRGYFRLNLGELYRRTGRQAGAESTLVEAMNIIGRTGRTNFISGLRGARALAELAMDTRQFQKAERWLDYLCTETAATLGTEHPDMIGNYLSRERFHTLRQEHDEALRYARLATGLALRVLRRGIVSMTEGEALAFARTLRNSADVLLSDVMVLGDSARLRSIPLLDLIVSTKGIVSDAFAMRSRDASMDPMHVSDQISRLHTLRADLARVYVRSARTPGGGDGRRTDSLSRIIDDLGSTIAREERAGPGIVPGELVRIADLYAALPRGSAMVEYLTYRSIRSTRSRYAALLFDHSGRTKLLDLADADSVERIIAGLRRAIQDAGASPQDHPSTGAATYTRLARSLYEKVWSPMEEFLRSAETIFIAPEGSLHLVAFAGLVDRKGTYVIERHRLHYVSAARDVRRMEADPESSAEGFLALGDPDFDASQVERFAALTDDDAVHQTPAPGWSGNLRSGISHLPEHPPSAVFRERGRRSRRSLPHIRTPWS